VYVMIYVPSMLQFPPLTAAVAEKVHTNGQRPADEPLPRGAPFVVAMPDVGAPDNDAVEVPVTIEALITFWQSESVVTWIDPAPDASVVTVCCVTNVVVPAIVNDVDEAENDVGAVTSRE
jgi:hypothetical protein